MSVSIVILTSLLMTAILILKIRHQKSDETKKKVNYLLAMIVVQVCLIVAGVLCGGDFLGRSVMDFLPALLFALLISSSHYQFSDITVALKLIICSGVVLCLYYIGCFLDLLPLPDISICRIVAIIFISLLVFLWVIGLKRRLGNVKVVMKSGTIWVFLNTAVDAIYTLAAVLLISLYIFLCSFGGPFYKIGLSVTLLLMAALIISICFRIATESLFVLMTKQELRIMESMKILHVEMHNEVSDEKSRYRELYDRLTDYFESEKPYLRSDLTINDIVRVVYSNKLYISRAISGFTGRNFCQFVNYYRVMHSMTIFRENPEMKVQDMAIKSGFNSIVSFNMAFHLYMGMSPSDWCRMERNIILKGQK